MSYYQGDFYQGDPGFLSGLGKVFGGVASFIPGVGGIIGKGITALSSLKKKTNVAIQQHPTLSAAGSAGLIGAGAGMMAPKMRMGKPRLTGTPGAAGKMRLPGQMRRHRRMRVTNPKALRRAIRRAKGFEKLARKVMHFTSPHRVKGRAVFRARRRSK